ncbi:PP0621 family protein [Leptothrix discophora]|uniref:PP0621 family protein n=1 Tax=Leptothrix discophora TaxID=89 RepID=A0ABT9G745_LEPDI|nr:PP0621 family protein [Leptothrix discophora]MDP4302303.1 PP0621 family protein [Leptothrix discophora]
MRALLWLLIGLAAYLLIRKWQRQREQASRRAQPAEVPRRPGAKPAETGRMVRCAHCGLHLPESEAVRGADARDYCSPAHLSAGPRAGLPS